MAAVLAAALSAAGTDGSGETAENETEIWNEGVGFYLAGDSTNALKTLRGLMLSREYGARAAEVVAKIQNDEARRPGCTNALERLEEAAAAAQIALRAAPGEKRANDNFTRAIDGLAALRETERINKILESARGKDPAALLADATAGIRRAMEEFETVLTNAPQAAVAAADGLSAEISKLADVWIPVKEAICAAVTNKEDAATISGRVDAAREKTAKAASLAGDLDAGARYPLAEAEQDFTDFYKMAATPPLSIKEDLVCQSNAWQDAKTQCGRQWQPEALDWTRAFRAKFPAWAQAYSQQAAADTNMPPFAAEAQAEISALSTKLEQLQIECTKEILPPKQEEALDAIRRIIELMPPQKGSQGGGQGQSGQNQKKEKNDGRSDQDKNGQQQEQNEDGGDDRNEDRQNPGEQDKDDASGEEDGKEEKDIEAVLRKAQERNDEHEADKRARMRKARLPPNEKDW